MVISRAASLGQRARAHERTDEGELTRAGYRPAVKSRRPQKHQRQPQERDADTDADANKDADAHRDAEDKDGAAGIYAYATSVGVGGGVYSGYRAARYSKEGNVAINY